MSKSCLENKAPKKEKKERCTHTEGSKKNIRNKVKGENDLFNWFTHPPLSLSALPETAIWSSWPRLRGVGVDGV